MIEGLLIWIYLGLGNILAVFHPLIVVFSLVFVAIMWVMSVGLRGLTDEESNGEFKKIYSAIPKKTLVVLMFLSLMYPSKDDLKWIIGGSVTINAIQSASDIEGVERLPKNIVNAMNMFLEDVVKKENNDGQ